MAYKEGVDLQMVATALMFAEFGFKCGEKGMNLEATLIATEELFK